MKAILCTAYGPPEVLQPGDLDKPMPKSNQILIRVRSAAVTISDCIVRSGKVRPLLWLPMRIFVGFGRPRNPVLGLDLAGDVETVGSAVRRFRVGDSVIAFTGKHFGAYAEYACLPADGVRGPQDALIALKPANLSYAEAAALPSRGGLAWYFLGRGQVQAGQRVLVFGASGATGTFAVQLAKHLGARVTGVCSTANLDFVKALGADTVIDYTQEDFTLRPERYDLIFDAVGKRYSQKIACRKALAPNGKLIDLHLMQVALAPDGQYKVGGLPAGTYSFRAFPDSDNPYWRSDASVVTITPGGVVQTVNLTLKPAQLYGTVVNSVHNPVLNAFISVTNGSGLRRDVNTRASGYWAVGGLVNDSYTLAVRPPLLHPELLPPAPLPLTLPGAVLPLELAFLPLPKTIGGQVVTNTGVDVYHARVEAWRTDALGQVSTLTDVDGNYTLNLAPGTWAITVRLTDDSNPTGWVYALSPQLVHFKADTSAESVTQNFTVTTRDATVTGKVLMPDESAPPFEVHVGLYSSEGVGLQQKIDASGNFSIQLPSGTYNVVINRFKVLK